MTTVMNARTLENIYGIVGQYYDHFDKKTEEHEVCVYNDADGFIRLTITRIKDGIMVLNALVKDEAKVEETE